MTDLGHNDDKNDERELENNDIDKEPVYIECEVCDGIGGWDIADNIEVYDEWKQCDVCEGTGEILL